jgi:hypothetical protein
MSVLKPLVIESSERTFGPCSKCASADVGVRYHAGTTHCSECRTIDSCRYTAACGENGTRGEHLVVGCQRCGYRWVESVEPER